MYSILLKDVQETSLGETLAKGQQLINRRVGIIHSIQEYRVSPSDPALFYFAGARANYNCFHSSTRKILPAIKNAGGASLSRERAKAAVIGEAVERYCSGIYDEDNFIYATFEEIKKDAVDLRMFVLYSQEQYSKKDFIFAKFSEKTKMNWVWGYSLTYNRPLLVPAGFVYVPYVFANKSAIIDQPVSTGLACANNKEEAILRGIYEVVERDAFMIMWHNMLCMPGIDLENVKNETARKIIERYPPGVKLYVHNITNDLEIPTMFGIVFQEFGDGPAAAVGAATRLNPEDALVKCLEETAHTRFYTRYLLRGRPNYKIRDDFSDITDLSHHPFLYGHREILPAVNFLRNSPYMTEIDKVSNRSSGTILGDIQVCLEILSKRGFEVIVVDITTQDIRQVGFVVTKVLIPGLQPLDVELKTRHLGGGRLYEVAKILGYKDRKTTAEELNKYPHPFP